MSESHELRVQMEQGARLVRVTPELRVLVNVREYLFNSEYM